MTNEKMERPGSIKQKQPTKPTQQNKPTFDQIEYELLVRADPEANILLALLYDRFGINPPSYAQYPYERGLVSLFRYSEKEIKQKMQKLGLETYKSQAQLNVDRKIKQEGTQMQTEKKEVQENLFSSVQPTLSSSRLEKKLAGLDEKTAGKTIKALSECQSVSILKDDLLKHYYEEYIISYFREIGPISQNFERNLGVVLPKVLLKTVVKGIKSIRDELPKEFLHCLTSWKKIYFFAGLTQKIEDSKLPSDLSLYNLTATYTKNGMHLLYSQHSYGKFRTVLELPEHKEVEAYET